MASDGWEEVRDRIKKGKGRSKWEEERIGYFEEKGVQMWEKKRRKEGTMYFGHMMKKDMDRSERWENIGEAKYNNRWYGRIKGEGVPSYLKKSWGKARWQMVARYELGNEIKKDGIARRRRRESIGCVDMRERHESMFRKNVYDGVGRGLGRRW